MGRYVRPSRSQPAGIGGSPPSEWIFIDGDKRSAIVTTAAFLRWNGYKLEFSDREMYDWLMSLYETGSVNKQSLDAWFRSHAVEFHRAR